MSYWVYLNCIHCGAPLTVENHWEGGTYAIGGIDRAELNITYNYGEHFADAIGYQDNENIHNFRDFLDGKKASEAIPALERAVATLGTDRDDDYWKAAPGNAGYALSILLDWAKQHPGGVFKVS